MQLINSHQPAQRHFRRLFWLVLGVVAALAIAGAAIPVSVLVFLKPDYVLYLPNDYYFVRASATNRMIYYPLISVQRDGTPCIPPTVGDIAVIGGLVVGHHMPPAQSRPWFFIIDTDSNSVRVHLDEIEWRRILSSRYGIDQITLEDPRSILARNPEQSTRQRVAAEEEWRRHLQRPGGSESPSKTQDRVDPSRDVIAEGGDK
jgi:hypothetical protein